MFTASLPLAPSPAKPRAPRLAMLAFALALVAPAILLHRDHLGPGRIPFYRDLSRTHLPFKRLATQEIHSGRLPLWSPQHASGSQLAANPNFFHLHPVSLLFLLLPFATAFSLGLAALSAAGSVGTGLWLRARGCSHLGAVLGGVAFALGGLLASTTNLYNLHATYASVPWALWTSARLVRGPTAPATAALALSLAVVATGGEPTAWAWALLLGPLLAAFRPSARALAATAGAAALSLLLAAAQLVPLAELTPTTVRGTGLTFAGSTFHSLRPARLLELVWPYPHGNPMSQDSRPDPSGTAAHDGATPLLLSIYPGWSVLALVLVGLGAARDRAWLAGTAALSLGLALGRHSPLFTLAWTLLPPLHWFRYPEKLLLPLFLVLAALAAAGTDRLERTLRRPRRLWALPLVVTLELLVAHARLVPGADAAGFLEPQPMHRALAGHRVYFWLEPERYAPPAPDPLAQLMRYPIEAIPPSGVPFGVDYVLDPDPDLLDSSRMLGFARLVHGASEARPRLLPLTAVDRIVSPRLLHYSWMQPLSSPELHTYALDDPMPYARVVDAADVRRVDDAVAAEITLASAGFDPRRNTILEGTPLLPRAARPGSTVWTRPTPSRIEVTATGPGVLVVAESYDRGWRATIAGTPTPVYPANLAFLAVVLPKSGESRVRFDFEPSGLRTGVGLSAIGALALAGLWLTPRYGRRRPRARAIPNAKAPITA